MPLSNVAIRRLGWFAIATILALLEFGRAFGFAGPLVAMPAGAMRLLALGTHRTRRLGSGPYAEHK